MHTVGLSWQNSAETAVVLTVAGSAMALAPMRSIRWLGAFARETAMIGFLYALWELANRISIIAPQGGYERGRWIRSAERHLPLPTERTVQHLILGHRYVVEAANLYYAAMHLSVMLGFLIWLFVRHRASYKPVRTVLALTTLGCLLIQLMPVAPPRMFPGIVDTGLLYNQSVYSNGLPIDQLSAMPSIHVAWATLVGYYVWRISPSRWRWLGPAHAVLMTFVVVATGNHWWLDGIVAVAVLVACAWLDRGLRRAWSAVRARRATVPAAEPEAVLV